MIENAIAPGTDGALSSRIAIANGSNTAAMMASVGGGSSAPNTMLIRRSEDLRRTEQCADHDTHRTQAQRAQDRQHVHQRRAVHEADQGSASP